MITLKKYAISFILLFVITLCPFMLMACGENSETLKVVQSFKTEYYVGEVLDVSTGILEYTKDGETKQVAVTSEMISTFTTSTIGTRNMVLTYNDKTITISYTVKPFQLVDNVRYNAVDSDTFKNYMQFDCANNKAYYYDAGGQETDISYSVIEMTISSQVKDNAVVYTLNYADFDEPATITMLSKNSFKFSLRDEVFVLA